MPSDWITSFLQVTETLRSPPSFRLWTAIATIAAVLERRVWTVTDVKPLFPNLYTVLAGAPASGKTIMVSYSREILGPLIKPGGIFLGPDNPSAASFMDSLKAAEKISINGMGVPTYSAMNVLCTELGDLISKYDKDFVAKLTTLYDNPQSYAMPRRTSVSVTIEVPCVNILAAATPDALGDTIPESAWGQGFTSRVIFIYGHIPEITRRMFQPPSQGDKKELQDQLKEFFEDLHGEFHWEPEAQQAIEDWFNLEKMAPVPTYGRLVNYAGRRDVHTMKLAMISAVSAGRGLTVTLEDFLRGRQWLLDAETTMPDVFRAIAQKSDGQLLQDAHYHFLTKFGKIARDKRQPIKEREIWEWFSTRSPQEKINGLIVALEKTGRMRRGSFPGDWVPAEINDSKFGQPE